MGIKGIKDIYDFSLSRIGISTEFTEHCVLLFTCRSRYLTHMHIIYKICCVSIQLKSVFFLRNHPGYFWRHNIHSFERMLEAECVGIWGIRQDNLPTRVGHRGGYPLKHLH